MLQEHAHRPFAPALRRTIVASLIVPLTLGPIAAPAYANGGGNTESPIKHVIVIIGENRTFDHVFATYQPVGNQSVDNLLSKGIINANGTPGPNFDRALQRSALDQYPESFRLSPENKAPYATLPPPVAGGPKSSYFPAGTPDTVLATYENGLPESYLAYMTTGGTGLTAYADVDTRIPNANALPPGPFQLTSSTLPYDAYSNSPVHRFYQMWQQLDCSVEHASAQNPSGCNADLFPWVEVTVGAGTNGMTQAAYAAANYASYPFTYLTTGEGASSMAFYNMQQGDAPYFKYLADHYASSDNYHQAVMGGTGANHVMLGTGDAIWFSDGNGNPAVPPNNVQVATGSANQGIVDEIENPNPQAGTNNWYAQDGYGNGGYGSPASGGGTYSNCADPHAPGVKPVLDYLASLARPVKSNCEPGHYYLLNNYNPGYFGNGNNAYTDNNNANTPFTIPPSNLRHIGDALGEKSISYAYFGDQWNQYVPDPYQLKYGSTDNYCTICNFFQYTSSIMTDANARAEHLKDTLDLYEDIANGTLPAVSFVKPSAIVDGHPASSKLDLFEGFVKKIVDAVHSNPDVWKDTAIFVTMDEGGGYYDSGYVQPLDFFGDGTRIPLLVVSPYSSGGHVSHDYADHVSILKFIERNWKLPPLTHRSRDNYPNPVYGPHNRYAPINGPAIGDLFDLFNFGSN
jgi:phospholipase C